MKILGTIDCGKTWTDIAEEETLYEVSNLEEARAFLEQLEQRPYDFPEPVTASLHGEVVVIWRGTGFMATIITIYRVID